MSTLANRTGTSTTKTKAARKRAALIGGAVTSSRLLIVAAGIAGGLSTRIPGWQQYDQTRISAGLGSVGNLLGATAVRWDSIHYLEIAGHGYNTAQNTVFFPMYPLLIHVLAWIVQSDVLAGVLISTAAFVISLLLLHRLAVEEVGIRAAGATVLLLAFAPLSFFFTAVYTESLFLALTLGSFRFARRGQFGRAGLVAAVAALTRIPGILLVIPLVMMYAQTHGFRLRLANRQRIVELGAISLPAVALAGFLVYLHGRGYGWLAPVTNQLTSTHEHSMTGPLVTIWRGLDDGVVGLATLPAGRFVVPGLASPFTVGSQNLIYLIVFGIAIASLIGAWRRLPKLYAIYSALVLIVCVWSPTPELPLRSIDRYSLVLFPLWMAAAAWLEERRRVWPVLCISTSLLIFYCVLAARWVFIA
jgi:hypothetical protein